MITPTDGKTPDLSAKEQHEVEKNQPPRAAVLHEIIRTQGDQELERSIAALWWSALAVVVVLAAFSQTSHSVIPAAITLVLWGIFAFALCPILQLLIIDQAHEAPNLGSTLNQSAFNLGNAAGAWIGGLVVASGADLADLPWTGALVSGLTVLTALYFIYLQRRDTAAVNVTG